MSKYNAKKTIVDGIVFDSTKEALRYKELKKREKQGKITSLILQPEYELMPTFKKNGKTYRRIVYRADFSYFDRESNRNIVEDVKGFKTDIYKLKKKLFEYLYDGLTIREV